MLEFRGVKGELQKVGNKSREKVTESGKRSTVQGNDRLIKVNKINK